MTVSQSGYVTYFTPQGLGQPPLVETLQVTNLQFAFQTRILRDLADTLNLGNQNNGNNGSSTPPPIQLPNPSPQLQEDKDTPVIIKAVFDGGSSTAGSIGDGPKPNSPTQTAHWQYGIDGNWNNPLDWSDAFAPFSWQNIVIGFAVTVTIDSAIGDSGPTTTAVNDLTIDAGAILNIVSGGSLVVSGTLDDFGLVKVNSTGADPTLTLNGPVIVEVGGEIEALGSLATVYFAADTVDNFGKIAADNYGQVFFEPGTTVTNEVGGQIEATDYGILTFDQTSVDNFGTIGANDYGQVYFKPGTAITNEVGGLIVAENYGTVLLDSGKTVKNFGTLEAATGGTLTLDDNVANHGQVLVQDGGTVVLVNDTITGGQINLSSTGSATDLEIAGVVTLTGGTVTLSDNAQNAIVSNGAAAELINYDSISGAGTIGDGNLTLDNFATIDATDAVPLILDTGANAIINEATTGILEASWRGTLDIESDVTNEGQVIAQHGGTVGLVGAVITGGIVTVDGVLDSTGKSAIDGAAITVGIGGTLESTSGTLTIDPSSLDNRGELLATSGGTLVLDGITVTNTAGTVEADVASTLDLETTTISGGTVAVDGLLDSTGTSAIDGAVIRIGASGILEATSGTLTIDPGSINNSGLLEANGGTLEINDTPVTNTGTLKATDKSTLVLNGGTVTNGGTVQVDVGSTLDLESATVIGGIVAIFGLLVTTGTSAIDDAAITNTGTIEVSALSSLTIDPSTIINTAGTITVDGTLTLDGVILTGGTLDIDSGATLDLINTQIVGVDLSDLGTINVIGNSTIDGFSEVFGGLVTVASGQTLVVDNALLIGTVTNHGTVKVDSGSISEFAGKASITGGELINAGTINADGTITFDTMQVINTGAIVVGDGTAADTLTLTNSTVTGAGTITVADHATVTLNGATINGGTIDDAGTLSVIASSEIENATVNGGGNLIVTAGTLTLSGDTLDGVTLAGGFTNVDTLTIDDTVTLDGATINGGIIDDAGTLSVNASSEIENATVNGGGTLIVASGQTLTLSKDTLDSVTLAGSFTNADTLTIDDTVTLDGATINGGIIDDAGTLSINASSEIENATVNGGGTLIVASGQTLTLSKDTLDSVTLAGSFTNADTLTIDDTVTLDGATINGGIIDDAGTLSVNASSEIENATVNGGGTLAVASGQTLILSGDTFDGVTLAGRFANADTLTIDDTVTLNGATINGGTISNSGTIDVTAASAITGTTLDAGAVTIGAGVTLTLDGETVSGTVFTDTAGGAILAVNHGANLTLSGVTIHGGALSIGSAGVVNIENGSTALDGVSVTNNGTINVDAKAFSATLILDDDSKIAGGTMTIGSSGLLDVEHGANGPNHGAVLDGVAVTDNGALDIGDLGSGAILTLDGGTSVLFNGTLTINAGSMLDVDGGITTISGSTAIGTGGSITNNSIIEATSGGTLNIAANINNTSGMLEAKSGGLLDVQTAISGGSAIIMGGTLEFDALSSVNVNFDNSNGYGELILGNPEHFSGQISGFAGTAPDAADSDQVELLNFTETSFSARFIGGNQILTLHDAHGDVVTLTFDNFDGTLEVSTSGGKTVIYDPPAEGAKDNSSTSAPAVVDGHIAAPTTGTILSSNQSLPVPATGSFNTGSSTAFAISTGADSGPSPADPHNEHSTGLASSGDDHLVEPFRIGGSQTFVAAVSPAEHDGDNVAGPVTNPPAVGDEHGHVTIATLDLPAISGEHVVDSLATGSPAGTSADADVGSLPIENGSSAAFTQTALSSLLNMLTSNHATLGSDRGTVSTVQTALEGDHATVSAIGTQSAFTSPALGVDNFVFHPNLGDDTTHNTSAHAADVGSIGGQNSPQPSGGAISVPELVPEMMFDPGHHDAADVSATLSQFQQMASSAHLLH